MLPRPLLGLLCLLAVVSAGCGDDAPVAGDAGRDADTALDAGADAGLEPLAAPPACPAPAGGPAVELTPLARLRADRTAGRLVGLVREDADAAATVRDGSQDTGWRPEAGATSTLELDLGPGIGRPVSIASLELAFADDGEPPEGLIVELRDACGGRPVARRIADAPARQLRFDLEGICASCVEITVRPGEGTRLVSVRLATTDAGVETPPVVPEPTDETVTRPTFGVVEGFYGRPWSFDERARMLDALGRAGLGAYVYAPKRDPRHRELWREPYPEPFVTRFGQLAALGRERGVEVAMGISPFLDLDPDDPGDVDILTSKLRRFVDAGAPAIAVFADDIELDAELRVDAELGAAHARVVDEVLRRLREDHPEVSAWLVGTVYSDERLARFADGSGYLSALSALDSEVRILWTGPGTFSTTLAPSDLERPSELVGRPVALWDNFWANDAGDAFLGRIMLAPWSGRDPVMRDATGGILQNPLIQGGLSRLAVGTFAAWTGRLDEGIPPEEATDPEALREAAARAELRFAWGAAADETRDAALLASVMRAFDGAPNGVPVDRTLSDAATEVASALEADTAADPTALEALASRAAELATLGSSLHHSGVAADVVDELVWPLRKQRAAAEVILAALELAAARLAGADASAERDRLADRRHTLQNGRSRYQVATEAIDRLAEAALSFSPDADPAAGPRAAPGFATPACAVGTELRLAPFESPDRLIVAGLPHPAVEGAAVRFTAEHPGRYRARIVARRGAAIRSVELELVCHPPPGG